MEIITDLTKLQEVSSPIEFITEKGIDGQEVKDIIEKLEEAFKENDTLVSLSAPQLGIMKRVVAIKFDDGIKYFINPIIKHKKEPSMIIETCASMPNKEILLARPNEVNIVYYNKELKYKDNKLLGLAAALFDQQCQILDGITPDLVGLVSDIEEDGHVADLSEEEMQQAVEIYKQFVQKQLDAAKDQITPELESDYKQLKFTEDVINGRIQVIKDEPAKNRAQRRAAAKLDKKQKKNVQALKEVMKEVEKAKKEKKESN